MIRLSQRGWNNVLIFAMLLMILLFNTTNNILVDNSEGEETRLLLPEGIPVMSINFGQHEIERIGRGWRVQPLLSLSEAELSQLVDKWQRVRGQTVAGLNLAQPYIAVVALAAEEQARIIKIMPQGEDLLIQTTEHTLLVKHTNIAELIPQELL